MVGNRPPRCEQEKRGLGSRRLQTEKKKDVGGESPSSEMDNKTKARKAEGRAEKGGKGGRQIQGGKGSLKKVNQLKGEGKQHW